MGTYRLLWRRQAGQVKAPDLHFTKRTDDTGTRMSNYL